MSYTYSDARQAINNRLHGKIGRIMDIRLAINDSVRSAHAFTRMVSMKRKQDTPSRLMDGIYDYPAPSDVSELVDFQPVGDRSGQLEWGRVAEQDFDRRKTADRNLLCIASDSGVLSLRASIDPANDLQTEVSTLDSISAGGTITAFGDATTPATDSDDYVKGTGAVSFGCSGAGTTAGIQSAMSSTLDISDYLNVGQAFAWVRLSSITGVSSVVLRIGSNSSNYHQISATVAHDDNAFRLGYQLVSLDFSSKTTVGSPTATSIAWFALYLGKTAVVGTGFGFDSLILTKGEQFSLVYYSDRPWQDTSGNWLKVSTADTDTLNAGEEEYDLIVKKCSEELSGLVKEYGDVSLYGKQHLDAKTAYELTNPDESLLVETDSYRWASVG